MKFFVIFAILAMAASAFALQTGVHSQLSWQASCNNNQGGYAIDVLRVTSAPGDVACTSGTGDTYYYCVDAIHLTSEDAAGFGGPGGGLPGDGPYFKDVYVDPIGRTVVNGEILSGVQDRNAAKNLWRPRVFVKRVGGTCYNWNYLPYSDMSMSPIEPLSIRMKKAENANSGMLGGFSLYSSSSASSDDALVFREIAPSGVDSMIIPLYNLGYAGSWGLGKSSIGQPTVLLYRGFNGLSSKAPLLFTTEKGSVFPATGANTSTVTFDMAVINPPPQSKPKK